MNPADPSPLPVLDRDAIAREAAAEGPVIIGNRVQVYRETSSTNDRAQELGRGSTPEGTCLFAESQTKGRGTRGRPWSSCPGLGLWFSILLRPAQHGFPEKLWHRLTPMTAAALVAAVEEILPEPRCEIKWPNDIFLQGRKLCGILSETQAGSWRHRENAASGGFAVLGIGFNVNHQESDWPKDLVNRATSLADAAGYRFNRNTVAGTLLRHLDRAYSQVRTDAGSQDLLEILRERNFLLGKRVSIHGPEIEHRVGTVTGIGSEGELLLRGPEGLVHSVVSGTVESWE
jgi:BirA family biotin operon repressor/biotin-[acetyl-CoA-carboxylase] ligase